jgi:hypothetical protein
VSAIREYDVRDYDAEATHKDYLIGDISHIGATRLGRPLIDAQIAAGYALTLQVTSRRRFFTPILLAPTAIVAQAHNSN